MQKVLIVEDDPAVRDVVVRALQRERLETEEFRDGESALEYLHEGGRCDLMILDIMLPGMDGVELCRRVRAESEVPIIMLSVRDDETSVVVGLEVGADDYVTKPFSPRQLVSRVRAQLRRREMDRHSSGPEDDVHRLVFPGLEIDLSRRLVTADGEPVELTAKEFDLLALLASHPGRVYTREQIMRHLWGGEFFGEARAADVHIQHIRHKIEPDPKNPRYVQTVRGAGYRFTEG
ncbi:MAG: response regulator transcription factor [Rubrobacteraceae bacterium]|uniref:response regulator transcription factor n=1 Tax=Rubrobacter naiadicus TaxID=1392641 RepID=UPI00235DD8D1|nr:response regulator transcription factor [Rubrobacter naiadicus]MBX6762946.1 response regulator transcription factor [Rubrobacteraceae bacterium]MCL6438487.1 response regulator transcription factor [Rubrobacteraceae bacterium]